METMGRPRDSSIPCIRLVGLANHIGLRMVGQRHCRKDGRKQPGILWFWKHFGFQIPMPTCLQSFAVELLETGEVVTAFRMFVSLRHQAENTNHVTKTATTFSGMTVLE